MPSVPVVPQPTGGASPTPKAKRPQLPVIQFRSQEPRMQLYFTLKKAATAVHAAPPGDRFYDVRGMRVKPTTVNGNLRVETSGSVARGALHNRIMKELRRIDTTPSAAQLKILAWLDEAPSPAYLIYALGITEEHDTTEFGFQPSGSCIRCNWFQKWIYAGTHKCCP
jgi:hypothetical protein